MKRVVWAAAIVACGVIVVAVVTGIKRVPERHVGLRVGGGGKFAIYDPGVHWVMPFAEAWVIYPVGGIERRFPLTGTFDAITGDGAEAGVALDFRLLIKKESAPEIYQTLGPQFLDAISDALGEAVAVEMAEWPKAGENEGPEAVAAAVVEEVTPKLADAGINLTGYRVDDWDVAFKEDAAPAFTVSPKPPRKIVFIGVDGGDWEIINPLVKRGVLPNFRKIIEQGTTGPLESVEPLLSPLVWTTIATGKLPEQHGILNFTVKDPETGKKVPITRLYRKVDAFWNIVGDYGRGVDVVGWLATYPAEAINGVMVTDRVGYLAYAEMEEQNGLAPGSVYPESRADAVSRFVVKSEDVRFADFSKILHIEGDEFEKNKLLPFDPKNPVNNMIMIVASALTYENIAKHLLTEGPDVLAVYFELVDAAGHLFMNYAPPRQSWVSEADFDKYKDAMLETYKMQDKIIGDFMDMCDENTVLILASDHGFKSGSSRPKLAGEIGGGHAAFWHQLNGIIGLYGPGVRRGHELTGGSVLDIAPTILALQGLPKPTDMPGRVLTGAFEPGLAGQFNNTAVATLQRRRAAAASPAPSDDASSGEALKKLEALGYITRDNPDAHNNLGQRYQEKGEYEKAIVEFKKALAINPDFPSALNNIGVCYGRLKQYSAAEEAFKRAISIKKDDVYAMNNLAILFMETGDLNSAIEYGEMAVRVEPNYANGHLTLGSIYATAGRLDRAEREFMKALELDPNNKRAADNLEKLRSHKAGAQP